MCVQGMNFRAEETFSIINKSKSWCSEKTKKDCRLWTQLKKEDRTHINRIRSEQGKKNYNEH